MEDNLAFHAILERAVTGLEYGQIDLTVQIKDGKVIIPTISMLKSQRIKFKDGTITTKDVI